MRIAADPVVEANKDTLRRWIDTINSGAFDRMPEFWVPDAVVHGGALGDTQERAEVGTIFAPIMTAFPDMRVSLDGMVGEGDKVASRCTARGTHTGSYFGVEATRKSVEIAVHGVYRFDDGKIVEMWGVDDVLTLLVELGVLPFDHDAASGFGVRTMSGRDRGGSHHDG